MSFKYLHKIKRKITPQKKETISDICRMMGIETPEEYKDDKTPIPRTAFSAKYVGKDGAMFVMGMPSTMIKKMQNATKYGARYLFIDKQRLEELDFDRTGMRIIPLDDGVERFGRYHDHYRNKYKGTIIGITGSVGKTTTRNYIAEIIGDASKFVSKDNFNSTNVVSTNIKTKLKGETDYIVMEAGAGGIDTIASSARIMTPDIGVITNIKPHHLNVYKTIDKVFEDKINMARCVKPDGIAVINFDDELLSSYDYGDTHVVKVGVNSSEDLDYRATNIVQDGAILRVDIVYGDNVAHVDANIIGEYNAYNIVEAFAVGKYLGFDDETIVKRMEGYTTEGVRQSIMSYGNKTFFVDCYNVCNDTIINSVKITEDYEIPEGGRKIAIVGGENKLGADAIEPVTRALGKALSGNKVDEMICFGSEDRSLGALNMFGDAQTLYDELVNDGCENAKLVLTYDDMVKALREDVKDGDMVLIKAMHFLNIAAAVDEAFGTNLCINENYLRKSAAPVEESGFNGILIPDMERVEIDGASSDIMKASSICIPSEIDGHKLFGINERAFAKSRAKAVDFGETLISIGVEAFADCGDLEEAVLPDTVVSVMDRAFAGCGSLRRFKAGKGIVHIGEEAFAGCRNLKTVELPEGAHCEIGKDAFPEDVNIVYY